MEAQLNRLLIDGEERSQMTIEVYRDLRVLAAMRAGVNEGKCALDAGTGPCASLAICVAELVGSDGQVIAVDYAREYAPAIKESIAKSGFSGRISFLVADLQHVPVRDGATDAAVSMDTIQNMYGNGLDVEDVVKKYVEESVRIVKHKGKVVVGTRHPVPRNKAQEAYIGLRLFESKLEHVLWGEQSHYYFEHELTSWLKKAGLQDIEAETIEHSIAYPNDRQEYNLARIRNRLMEVQPSALKVKLGNELRFLLQAVEEHGEEFLPTLIVTGTKV